MVNAQEWLDKNYPKEERNKTEKIYLNEPSLEGELDLGDFTYWNLKVLISLQIGATKLTFKNQGERVEIITNSWWEIHKDFGEYEHPKKYWQDRGFDYSTTQQWIKVGLVPKDYNLATYGRGKGYNPTTINKGELKREYCQAKNWLDFNYLLDKRSEIKKLDLWGKNENLTGELDLSDFPNLQKLNVSYNQLTKLTLPTNPTDLRKLNLINNNFPAQDLSFLVPYTNLKKLWLGNNKFTGSLDYLSGMEQLKELDISNTDINEVNIDKLPRSLKEIEYYTYQRPNCKLTEIVSQLEKVRYGWCQKCKEPNTSPNWCQPCAEQEWKQDLEQLTGQELVEKFIQQQGKDEEGDDKLQWIPYEEFTNIEHLADGGFGKIYKAKWGKCGDGSDKMIAIKSLTNSQNITLEFLTEITNTNLVDGWVVNCFGISQDPITKNYVMVMSYIKNGNLRQYLQQKNQKLSLENKVGKLQYIAWGLNNIHDQNLTHRDFHSGNIVGLYITDFGLSKPANYQSEVGKIYGVLPYVAPEVLRGQPYTQASDIYSLGIVMYELFANAYPYPKLDNLAIAICNGLRPNIDKIKIPQLLKDLIKRCWDANPKQRLNAKELSEIISSWYYEKIKTNTPFYQQYLATKDEYNTFSQNTPYQIHPTATTTSKMINTKEITQRLQQLKVSEEYHTKALEGLKIDNLNNLQIEEDNEEESELQAQILQEPYGKPSSSK